jgi:hypothetical protein
MQKPLSSSRRSRKTWRACSPRFPSKARCPRRLRLRQDRPSRRKPECSRRRHRHAGSTHRGGSIHRGGSTTTTNGNLSKRSDIVEVRLHAAVRPSGPLASVRSCPHRVICDRSSRFSTPVHFRFASKADLPLAALVDPPLIPGRRSDYSHPPQEEGAGGGDGSHGERQHDYLAPNDAGRLRRRLGRPSR